MSISFSTKSFSPTLLPQTCSLKIESTSWLFSLLFSLPSSFYLSFYLNENPFLFFSASRSRRSLNDLWLKHLRYQVLLHRTFSVSLRTTPFLFVSSSLKSAIRKSHFSGRLISSKLLKLTRSTLISEQTINQTPPVSFSMRQATIRPD